MKTIRVITILGLVLINMVHTGDDGLVDHTQLIKKLMMQNSNLLSLISEIREQEKLDNTTSNNSPSIEKSRFRETEVTRQVVNPTKAPTNVYRKKECHVIKPKMIVNENTNSNQPQNNDSQLLELMRRQATQYQEVILELEEEESKLSVSAGQRYDLDGAKNSSKYAQVAYRVGDKSHAFVELQKRKINDIFSGHTKNVCVGLKKYFRQKDEKFTPYGAVMYTMQLADMGGDLSYDLDQSAIRSIAARIGLECKIDKHAKFDLFYEKGGKDDHLLKVDGSTRTLKAEKSVIGMGVNYEF
ncbi:MAG: hypothetical protein KC646_04335 [Candidatus Cloacimonetes bacterium]|nr:hypothetical protein [Candidatus Cloacimonadota bacterium]